MPPGLGLLAASRPMLVQEDMRQEHPVQVRSEDFEPLLPIDIIRPPQQRGDMAQPELIPPLESTEMIEAEIEDRKAEEEKDPRYKGDVNAPVDAPHPLAEPPEPPL